MIKVNYNEKFIKVSGHANFDEYGKDIVCASVSSIVYTTINGILSLDNKAIEVKDTNILEIDIIKNDITTKKLINNMICLLEELEKQYPDNIKIIKGE